MAKRMKSRISDDLSLLSRNSDMTRALASVLKEARLSRKLSQAELARKLGIRQRQISDLERATIDPRLSTIQNVARALDLELMLIPHHLISTVEALERTGGDAGKRPLYALGDEDTQGASDEPAQSEVGANEPTGPRDHGSRPRRGPQR
jgi:transcriptional regulator with XRE-family HTH domain